LIDRRQRGSNFGWGGGTSRMRDAGLRIQDGDGGCAWCADRRDEWRRFGSGGVWDSLRGAGCCMWSGGSSDG